MSTKQTTIRLDAQTLDRIAAVQEAATVPVSRSAVAQEAIRRGLAEIERERDVPTAPPVNAVVRFEAGHRRADVVESPAGWHVEVSEMLGGKWRRTGLQSAADFEGAKVFAEGAIHGAGFFVKIDAVDNASGQVGEIMEKIEAIKEASPCG